MRHLVFLGLRTTKRPTTSSANKHEKFSMEVRSDHFESAKSYFFDTSSWGPFCDVTLTLKQALQSKGEVRTRTLRSWELGKSGRWHIHCAIELPSHFDAVALERLIRKCWAKVEWGYSRILIRDGANNGWINYMLKGRQKSAFDNFLDCIVIESLHNPIADA